MSHSIYSSLCSLTQSMLFYLFLRWDVVIWVCSFFTIVPVTHFPVSEHLSCFQYFVITIFVWCMFLHFCRQPLELLSLLYVVIFHYKFMYALMKWEKTYHHINYHNFHNITSFSVWLWGSKEESDRHSCRAAMAGAPRDSKCILLDVCI